MLKTWRDPYPPFFILSFLAGLVGTGIWAAFWFGWLGSYPVVLHTQMMIPLFFCAAALGFLLTAVPKFTGTPAASRAEQNTLLLVSLAMVVAALVGAGKLFSCLAFVQILFFVIFVQPRFRAKQTQLPPSFTLIGFGMLSWFCSALLLMLAAFFQLPAWVQFGAYRLLYYGVFIFFALGVGGKLFPMIMGNMPPAMVSFGGKGKKAAQVEMAYVVGGTLIFVSCLFESFSTYFLILRALLVSIIAILQWRLWERAPVKSVMVKCLRASAWCLVLGFWPGIIWPSYAIHFNHLIFIGSLGLMVHAISSRVLLSHGGHSLQLELKSKVLWTLLSLFLLAAATRMSAPFMRDPFSHYAYAAFTWWLAALVWWFGLGKKMLKAASSSPNSSGPNG